ncbi:MAG: cation diffusion facilitator family transporter [Candidatus Sumerlaeia bacterium]|nr:cation diffusion facilitator family transporter [Candidatus Sumerlaeia bacterium]
MHEHNHIFIPDVNKYKRALILAVSITGSMAIIEFVAGHIAKSLALIGDAGHMVTDSLALILALFALLYSQKSANTRKTFGYYRAEIIAALFNGTLLLGMAFFIFYHGVHRLIKPSVVHGEIMLGVALVGLAANITGILILNRTGKTNLNVQGAYLHMLGDAMSSVGVVIAAGVIVLTGWTIIDPLIACLIGIMILKNAIGLVLDASNILLEAVPKQIDLQLVKEQIEQVKGVNAVHDLHIWTITSGVYALSCHLLLDDQRLSSSSDILNEVNKLVADKFNIKHTTIQLECFTDDSRVHQQENK